VRAERALAVFDRGVALADPGRRQRGALEVVDGERLHRVRGPATRFV